MKGPKRPSKAPLGVYSGPRKGPVTTRRRAQCQECFAPPTKGRKPLRPKTPEAENPLYNKYMNKTNGGRQPPLFCSNTLLLIFTYFLLLQIFLVVTYLFLFLFLFILIYYYSYSYLFYSYSYFFLLVFFLLLSSFILTSILILIRTYSYVQAYQ